jgi:hypothetical protein
MSDFIPATTGLSRVFIIEGRAGPRFEPEYFSCYRAQALTKNFGDVTDIECPDPTRPGSFVKIGSFQSGEERATITLEGRYAIDLRSRLLRLAKNKCPVDVQLHFGDCEDLSDPTSFKKILYLEDVFMTTYNTEDLGSLQSDDIAAVNESVDLSAAEIYDVVPQAYSAKAADLVTNEVVDVVICDEVECGDCGDPSGGCNGIFAITLSAGGSPSTPPDVVYSVDGGTDWFAHDIETLGAAEDPDAVACVYGKLVVVSNATGSLHYADLDEFDEFGTDPAFTEVATGFGAGVGEPNNIVGLGNIGFIVGNDGYVYKVTNPANGVTALESGDLTISHLLAVDALSKSFVVAVGNDGVILVSEDGTNFSLLTTPPVGIGVNITAVMLKTKREWWIGTSGGDLYYTEDAGAHWTQKEFTDDGAGTVHDITWATESVIYFSHETAGGVGRIWASFDGGYTFTVMPFGSAIMPAADKFNAIAACRNDPELIVAGGLDDDASDGIIVLGTM